MRVMMRVMMRAMMRVTLMLIVITSKKKKSGVNLKKWGVLS